MLDLKILDSVNGDLSAQTWPDPAFVSSVYSLVQQIYKCLVTNPGEDQFDPTYGSGLRAQIIGLNGQESERVKQVVGTALQKVRDDLTSGPQSDDPTERLVNLELLGLQFNPNDTSWSVQVNVITEAGTQAVTLGV